MFTLLNSVAIGRVPSVLLFLMNDIQSNLTIVIATVDIGIPPRVLNTAYKNGSKIS